MVFVHGSLSDGGYWNDQVNAFAQAGFRAIAYSRRYSPPNNNKAQPGYSAVVDADDLPPLFTRLRLGRVHVVGHSYGAYTALFLAARHPELVRTLVLAEAPAVTLLEHLEGDRVATGKATFADIQARMVKPMKAAFRKAIARPDAAHSSIMFWMTRTHGTRCRKRRGTICSTTPANGT